MHSIDLSLTDGQQQTRQITRCTWSENAAPANEKYTGLMLMETLQKMFTLRLLSAPTSNL